MQYSQYLDKFRQIYWQHFPKLQQRGTIFTLKKKKLNWYKVLHRAENRDLAYIVSFVIHFCFDHVKPNPKGVNPITSRQHKFVHCQNHPPIDFLLSLLSGISIFLPQFPFHSAKFSMKV